MSWDIESCPHCDRGLRITNNIIPRHEKHLAYVPYALYNRIEKKFGTSVKEQAKRNLCPASGKKYSHLCEETKKWVK